MLMFWGRKNLLWQIHSVVSAKWGTTILPLKTVTDLVSFTVLMCSEVLESFSIAAVPVQYGKGILGVTSVT